MGLTLLLGGLAMLAMLLKCLLGLRQSSSGMPCLPRLPLLGSLLSLRSELPPHLLFTRLTHTYGKLYTLYMGPHLAVVVNDYTHAREVLLGKGREFAGRPYMVRKTRPANNSDSLWCVHTYIHFLSEGC